MEIKKYQQGDVILRSVGEIRGELQDGLILARSEVTGHAHAVSGDAALYVDGESQFLDVKGLAVLQHEEHAHITIDQGTYQVIHVREMDWLSEEERLVVD